MAKAGSEFFYISWVNEFQGDEVLYGTADGKIGLVQLTRQGGHAHWMLEPESSTANGSATSGAVQARITSLSLIWFKIFTLTKIT